MLSHQEITVITEFVSQNSVAIGVKSDVENAPYFTSELADCIKNS